ncbi:MAG: mannitol dehydrogenase family protein [Candidatus Thiodiazotropha sp. (ex Ctena orbiculata)]|uniref:Mannitol dehydrogenase family protein n=1 Tax=Candidatus Thiodiazotropha taylori TaxID=2792791 RepID=A0A944MBS0_9GAMM|nr:mannitol dehydrogenase family protein [Candidatus Thiodiazotropha taylori]MBT3026835.1 mannitol dehydrogenase family protein [Candidatus Thiodiazotropha taylori]MBT3034043.1 mannitol dehydrogenase family protein [Candidatus Thiodiazotropha taylori]MBV2138899.1 mannitol dehydrogenase family protein [Candidatus Thiodiazotropha taylori]
MKTRLNEARLAELPEDVEVYDYDRLSVGLGIVHLGIGSFHRAHQAVYTDLALARHRGDWGILGVSFRSGRIAAALNPQGGLYTVIEREGGIRHGRIVGCVKQVAVLSEEAERILSIMSSKEIRIFSATVTEKGYYLDPVSGRLDLDDSMIKADLIQPQTPKTMPALVVEALARRRERNTGPVTVMSCDNLTANGKKMRRSILDFATARDPSLAEWISASVTFPCTMVDRIVPAPGENTVSDAANLIGCDDPAALMTEPFRQWVIEDQFAAGRPAWEDAGAQFVEDVVPFEHAKLRLLNGSHSTFAYLGRLIGYDYIHQSVSNQRLVALVRHQMFNEVIPGLASVEMDLGEYCQTVLRRFANRTLPYTTIQVASDGSQKIPQRWLPAIAASIDNGRRPRALAFSFASWARFLEGRDDDGRVFPINDPDSRWLSDRTKKDIDSETVIHCLIERLGGIASNVSGANLFLDDAAFWLDRMRNYSVADSIREFSSSWV